MTSNTLRVAAVAAAAASSYSIAPTQQSADQKDRETIVVTASPLDQDRAFLRFKEQ